MWELGVPFKLRRPWNCLCSRVCDIAGNKIYDQYHDIALSVRSLMKIDPYLDYWQKDRAKSVDFICVMFMHKVAGVIP